MTRSTPSGITPPTPGLEHEEPEFAIEDDIPSDDGRASAHRDRDRESERGESRRERTGKPERE